MRKKTFKKLLKKEQAKRIFVVGVVVTTLCVAAGLFVFFRLPESSGAKRLVTLYDRGSKHVIVTRARTVRDALMAAKITVDSHDIVEPSVATKLTDQYEDVIIYRSRLVAIVDGGTRQSVMTVAQSPNQILEAAKLSPLGEKDKASMKQGNFVTEGASTKLIVERVEVKQEAPAPAPVIFAPGPNALTPSKGAQVFVDSSGVAHRETYYDLPMNVVIGACGGGGYTIRSDGAKIDANGYVLVAANYASYPRCTVVETSLGPGKVYDTGGFAARHPYGFDLATDWTNYDGR